MSQVATFEFGLVVGPQVPAKSLKELVEWVKANPAQGSYATPAAGTLPHFFAGSFARAAGLELHHVGYRGSAAALTDLVGGQVPVLVTTTSDLLENHKAGRIRVLATSDKAAFAVPPRPADVPGGRLRHPGHRLVRRSRPPGRPPNSSSATTRCRRRGANPGGEGAPIGLRPATHRHLGGRARPHPEGRLRVVGPRRRRPRASPRSNETAAHAPAAIDRFRKRH